MSNVLAGAAGSGGARGTGMMMDWIRRHGGRRLVAAVAGAGVALLVGLFSQPASAERLKEVASIQGVRSNQLIGYGLMVGLDGTGDQTTQAPFTAQSMRSLLQQLGIQLPPGVTPQLKNSAAVIVTAQLPAFAQPGQMIDVTVSSVGNAKSLRGGTLLLTPLRGVDGEIYALAQGNVVVGGEIKNGLVRNFYAAMMLYYVGSCQYVPTKHNQSGFLCSPMLQSNRLIRPRITL